MSRASTSLSAPLLRRAVSRPAPLLSALVLLASVAEAQTPPEPQPVAPEPASAAAASDEASSAPAEAAAPPSAVAPEESSTAAPESTAATAAPVSAAPPAPAPAAAEATAAPEPVAPTPGPAAKPAKVVPEFSAAPGKGFTARFGDTFSLNLRSRIQLRYQLNEPPPGEDGERADPVQTVGIGTVRLWLSGNIFTPRFTYLLQLALGPRDYRDGATSPVYDAVLDYRAHRDLGVRVGQYFVPFDRLRTIREFALQMLDRPRPVVELTLDRDVGAMLYSDHFLGERSPLAYRLGVFGGGGPNLVVGKEPGALFVGRLELRPLGDIDDDSEGDLARREKPGLALGGGLAANLNTDRQRSTTGTTYTLGTFDYLHAAADLVFKWRGLALEAEYLRKAAGEDMLAGQSEDGTALEEYSRSGHGWVAQASYVFDPPLEVVGRLSGLYADEGTDPAFIAETEALGQEVALGLNYYLNGHGLKVQSDWIARMPHDFDFSASDHLFQVALDGTF